MRELQNKMKRTVQTSVNSDSDDSIKSIKEIKKSNVFQNNNNKLSENENRSDSSNWMKNEGINKNEKNENNYKNTNNFSKNNSNYTSPTINRKNSVDSVSTDSSSLGIRYGHSDEKVNKENFFASKHFSYKLFLVSQTKNESKLVGHHIYISII